MIKRYVDLSSREQLKVVLLKDFIEEPLDVCNNLFEFLGLSSLESLEEEHRMQSFRTRSRLLQRGFVMARKLARKINIYDRIPTHILETIQKLNVGDTSLPEMDPLVRLWLYEHYQPKNQKLEEFLDRELNHWQMDFTNSDTISSTPPD